MANNANTDHDDRDDEVEDRLVIGIDFGTTFSGVAWATQVEFEDNQINLITSWPGNGREEGKVPTELWYSDDGEPAWGYDIPVDVEPFRWFKLLLLRDEDLGNELRHDKFVVQAKALIDSSGKTPQGLITDYLRLLWDHTISTIERAHGETVVEALVFHLVITVPAIWKSYARQAMEDAIRDAGILDDRLAGPTRLTFAPEPEAAALPTLLEQGAGVQPGNIYLICDAGGGTVDLITYQVTSRKPIVLEEMTEGTGGLCGGVFIDQVFESLCRGRLGSRWKRLSESGRRDIMRNEWEHGIKPQFRPEKGGKEYIVSLPAEVFRGQDDAIYNDTNRRPHIKNGRIHFTSPDIEKAFDGVLFKIRDLISHQIGAVNARGFSITGIILVGGLGASPYLYEYLKSAYSKAGIVVLQSGGMRVRTAICRGAVHKGFLEPQKEQQNDNQRVSHIQAPIKVLSRVSRSSYGTEFSTPFDKSKHLLKEKYWCPRSDSWRASGQMEWYLRRGQVIANAKPVSNSWVQFRGPEEFDGTISCTIFQCEDEVPPTRKSDNVKVLAKFRGNLDIKYSDLQKRTSENGKTFGVLELVLELVPSGASVELVLYVDGRRQTLDNAMLESGYMLEIEPNQ